MLAISDESRSVPLMTEEWTYVCTVNDIIVGTGVAALDNEGIVDWQHGDAAFYKLQHHALGKIGVVALQPQPGSGAEVGGDPGVSGLEGIEKVARHGMSTLAADFQG